jgi:hypothetical protein
MIEIIGKGVKHALKECRRQFNSQRWNCSPLDWEQVFTEGGILRKRKCVLDFHDYIRISDIGRQRYHGSKQTRLTK